LTLESHPDCRAAPRRVDPGKEVQAEGHPGSPEAVDVGVGERAGKARRDQALHAAIAGLPLFEREVWLLAARDGLTDREIGWRLALGEFEVRGYLVAALIRIAAALDDAEGA
jgi:DNA-directed RNA polymerase specialized sigma24 family protein